MRGSGGSLVGDVWVTPIARGDKLQRGRADVVVPPVALDSQCVKGNNRQKNKSKKMNKQNHWVTPFFIFAFAIYGGVSNSSQELTWNNYLGTS